MLVILSLVCLTHSLFIGHLHIQHCRTCLPLCLISVFTFAMTCSVHKAVSLSLSFSTQTETWLSWTTGKLPGRGSRKGAISPPAMTTGAALRIYGRIRLFHAWHTGYPISHSDFPNFLQHWGGITVIIKKKKKTKKINKDKDVRPGKNTGPGWERSVGRRSLFHRAGNASVRSARSLAKRSPHLEQSGDDGETLCRRSLKDSLTPRVIQTTHPIITLMHQADTLRGIAVQWGSYTIWHRVYVE